MGDVTGGLQFTYIYWMITALYVMSYWVKANVVL